MSQLGQPLHAFDREKFRDLRIARLKKPKIHHPRWASAIFLRDLLVMDDKHPLALAGTMGGENSEIDATTSDVCIEAARLIRYRLLKFPPSQISSGVTSI